MKERSDVSKFESRWLIRGAVCTRGPLHVGDGGTGRIDNRSQPADKAKGESDASTVCTDSQGRACIPGSAIKGALRARAKALGWDDGWKKLFGPDDATLPDAEGGKLEFSDALLVPGAALPQFAPRQGGKSWHPDYEQTGAPPHWDSARFTGIAVSVSLDRRTRTAKEHLLYHLEFVPADVSFDLEVTGENLSREEIGRVIALLGALNEDDSSNPYPVTLGAQVSNAWGRVKWCLSGITRFDEEDLKRWLKPPSDGVEQPTDGVGYGLCRTFSEEIKAKALNRFSKNALIITLTLTFLDPLLVRDPEQEDRRKRHKERFRESAAKNRKPPDAAPILDEKGYPILPAKAMRGVLRSHAERILRTMNHLILEPSRVRPVRKWEEIDGLDLISQIFGASGWQAPLETSAFTWAKWDRQRHLQSPEWLDQEHVAIDRFTGGAAEQKKFDTKAVGGAVLHGKLTLDIDRIKSLNLNSIFRGLVGLILRDLVEGDLAFGSGVAKGYGACAATGLVTDGAARFTSLEAWFADAAVTASVAALRAIQPVEPSTQRPIPEEDSHAKRVL